VQSRAAIGALLALAVLLSSALAFGAGWRRLYSKEGVTVSAKDRPGSDLPILRGVGVLPTNLYQLLAIIDDVPRHKEWVYRLQTSVLLSRPDPLHARAYMRFGFPWPTSDRDGIVDVVVRRKWKPHHELWITFKSAVDKRRPPLKGVVRVPRTIGFTRLRWLDPNHTHIIYEIDTDPAGNLPRWLVRWISKDLPLRIVRGLRKQLRRKRRSYTKFLRIWDPRLRAQPDAPPGFPLPGVQVTKLPGFKPAKPPAPPATP